MIFFEQFSNTVLLLHLGIVLIWHEFFKKHSSHPPLPYCCHNIWLEKNNEDTCVQSYFSWLLRLLLRPCHNKSYSFPYYTTAGLCTDKESTTIAAILDLSENAYTVCKQQQIVRNLKILWFLGAYLKSMMAAMALLALQGHNYRISRDPTQKVMGVTV